ncbi:hypothetical protein DICVIV_08809 [Dictyocaulus viviparus]|uniref:ERAP1-like C-terminal domain-containing protein n=1 Tax=Dictyocaulus viviparus TaxID=29172 RepID=A0A0D8XKH6_DICVI|nr:hypothetical protein DICVIV_08809 [Dictyocaulus viviparus]
MKIIEQLTKNHKPTIKKSQVDLVKYSTALKLLNYVKNEKDYLPWSETIDYLTALAKLFGIGKGSELFKHYVQYVLKPMYEEINNEDIARHYKNDSMFFEIIAAPLRPLAYCYGVKKGGQEAFDKAASIVVEPYCICNSTSRYLCCVSFCFQKSSGLEVHVQFPNGKSTLHHGKVQSNSMF